MSGQQQPDNLSATGNRDRPKVRTGRPRRLRSHVSVHLQEPLASNPSETWKCQSKERFRTSPLPGSVGSTVATTPGSGTPATFYQTNCFFPIFGCCWGGLPPTTGPNNRLSSVPADERPFPDHIHVKIVSDQCGRGIRRQFEVGCLQCIDGKNIMVREIPLRGTGSAIPFHPEVCRRLNGSSGKSPAVRTARPGRKFPDRRRNVVDHPVPPSGTRRGIRVIRRDGNALRPLGKMSPPDSGRDVSAGTSEPRKDLSHPDAPAIPEVRTGNLDGGLGKRTGRHHHKKKKPCNSPSIHFHFYLTLP